MNTAAVNAKLGFIAVLFINGIFFSEAAHIKIHIVPDHGEMRRFARDASSTACSDSQRLERSSIELPGMLSMLNERVSFYRSEYVTRRIRCLIESSTVAGLNSVYVSSVLAEYNASGCTSFPHGGVVRDQFLGVTPNDIDFKIDCDIFQVLDICRQNWNDTYCTSTNSANQTFVHIGQPKSAALDFGETDNEFYGPLRFLEYTVNSLVYWPDRGIILDIARSGVEDVCAKRIRIPSDDNDSVASWNESWIDRGNNDVKVYRFWKLRVRNFMPFNDATRNFIVNEAQAAIERENPTGSVFKRRFYCRNVYDGSSYISESNVCYANDSAICINGLTTSARYDIKLREDMGDEYIDDLVLPICTTESAIVTTMANAASSVMISKFCSFLLLVVGLLSF